MTRQRHSPERSHAICDVIKQILRPTTSKFFYIPWPNPSIFIFELKSKHDYWGIGIMDRLTMTIVRYVELLCKHGIKYGAKIVSFYFIGKNGNNY